MFCWNDAINVLYDTSTLRLITTLDELTGPI
jgi:hypothetical protein